MPAVPKTRNEEAGLAQEGPLLTSLLCHRATVLLLLGTIEAQLH